MNKVLPTLAVLLVACTPTASDITLPNPDLDLCVFGVNRYYAMDLGPRHVQWASERTGLTLSASFRVAGSGVPTHYSPDRRVTAAATTDCVAVFIPVSASALTEEGEREVEGLVHDHQYIVISGTRGTPLTLAHELGHWYGLQHTDHGVMSKDPPWSTREAW